MSLESIKTIGEAEEQAKRIKAEAAAEAKRMMSEAESKGIEAVEAAKQKAVDEVRELTKQADVKATDKAKDLADNTENKKASMRIKAEKQLAQAANLIVERIVSD